MIRSLEKTLVENMWVFIGMLVMFAGIIFFGSIFNASLVSLAERQREVATLRVLGYGPWQIGSLLVAGEHDRHHGGHACWECRWATCLTIGCRGVVRQRDVPFSRRLLAGHVDLDGRAGRGVRPGRPPVRPMDHPPHGLALNAASSDE